MNHPKVTIIRVFSRKVIIAILITVSAAGAFAALGDGNKKASTRPNSSLLSGRTAAQKNYFTLNSGYSFKGSQVLNSNSDKTYFNLNTVVTLQRGNNTYIVPLKKKAIFDKVKIDISNRQLRRN